MKAWETIRLLLACQHACERLTKISSKREELQRRLNALKSKMENMDDKVQRLVAELDSNNEDQKAKEKEIKDLEARKRRLEAESIKASSNKLCQEIMQEIERCKEKIDTLETAVLEILVEKDSIICELKEARTLQTDYSQQRDEEEQEIQNTLKVLDEEERQEKENLHKLEREFPVEDESLQHFSDLVKKGKHNAVVDVIKKTCPGCNLEICTSLLQEAIELEEIVKCESCDRFIFSAIGAIIHCISEEDIELGQLPLPPHLALRDKKTVCIRDVCGLWDDPFENFILQGRGRTSNGRTVSFGMRESLFGQCWTLNWESDAMWRIYSPDKNGVKIRTTIKKLFESIYNAIPTGKRNVSCFIGKVEYLLNYSEIGLKRNVLFGFLSFRQSENVWHTILVSE